MSRILTIASLSFLVLISCKKEEDCLDAKKTISLYATGVSMTGNAKIGENVSITIYYNYNKGCELFSSCTETFDGFTVSYQLSGTKNECICSAALTATNTVYTTRFHGSGTYTLNFTQADGAVITKKIVIQ